MFLVNHSEGQAGKLKLAEGEKVFTVKRRLSDAARLAAKNMVVKRAGEALYFWPATEHATPRKRRGRPPKSQSKTE